MKKKLIVCPTKEKERILIENSEKEFTPIKFMTKEEFFQNYFFSYDKKTIAYLMKKYGYDKYFKTTRGVGYMLSE